MAVPDVVGTTSSEATATLQAAGLKVNVVGVPSSEPRGTVVAQNPAAGQEAPAGSTVRLNVAQAPGTTTGDDDAAAGNDDDPASRDRAGDGAGGRRRGARGRRGRVRRRGPEGRRYVPSDEAQGRVVAQARPAGTTLKRGDTVQLNVSVGPDPPAAASVPNCRRPPARRGAAGARAGRLRGARAPTGGGGPGDEQQHRRLADARGRGEHPGRLARHPLRLG